MTEKRFTLTNPKNFFQEMKCGIDDRGITLTFNEVVTLLNNLSDEKQELKKEKNKWIIDYNGLNTEYGWLKEENEQLKIRFKEERDTAMKLGSECDNLTIKNQKLELEIIRLETIIKSGEKYD